MFGIVHEEKELPCINMSMKLQGYLLGYDVLQGGVIVNSHRYAKPVMNLVVNTGKDLLLTAANDANFALFGYVTSTLGNANNGALAFCHRGSGTTAPASTDTGLQTPIGNKTSTFLSGDPNTGTRYDRENGKVVMRVTHDHEIESADSNINELGWFGSYSGSYKMFSRIVLPSTITVLTGQALRTVYQLEVSITPITPTSCAPSISGWTTDGDYRWEALFPTTSTVFGSIPMNLMPTIGTSGSPVKTGSIAPDNHGLVPSLFQSYLSSIKVSLFGSTKTFNSFGTAPTSEAASSTVYNVGRDASGGNSSIATQAYTNGSFYRDVVIIMQPNWTGYSSISVYAMRLFGLMYIFDNPQTKTNTQRLTITYRVSVS